MPGIFISYRRSDSSGHAGRLGDDLRDRFGDLVFQDVDNIPDGEVFSDVIDRALQGCDVALIVIGRDWVTTVDEKGRRRLDDPRDWVRVETSLALSRKIRVVPVLVGGAKPPHADDLPDDLKPLTERQARELRDNSWDADVAALVSRLSEIVGVKAAARSAATASTPGSSSKLWVWIAAGVVGVALAIGLWRGNEARREASQADAQLVADAGATVAGNEAAADPPPAEPQGYDIAGEWEDAERSTYRLVADPAGGYALEQTGPSDAEALQGHATQMGHKFTIELQTGNGSELVTEHAELILSSDGSTLTGVRRREGADPQDWQLTFVQPNPPQ